jgi:hypothetical protein
MLYSISAGQVFLSSARARYSDWFVVESDLEHTHIAVQGHAYCSSSTHIYPYEHTERLVCARQMPTDAET